MKENKISLLDCTVKNHSGGSGLHTSGVGSNIAVYGSNILNLENCLIDWCYISHNYISGWISKDFIWGVYKDEIYNQKFYQPIIYQYWKFLVSINRFSHEQK